ncbi:hypothetical protein SPRG_06455 [Saprolegnia parasitica CBS 223.65]|uniref:EF-hand domain-containing protein n=1 Tax=Saprolegnia parasitica (strain CBS 223.65) TaxID=695850 RepID=A0A067CCW4_SAPPC|nr:hypothetical protein SPRG_06455 [Saprolegnia parasitica CBS 223.65]KDO28599.1 hypothetical protein SPRG_06455 [Saprolegnia parasitica CBS 223.65]|eukprot:XP_012200662.1 hypothetical protein SPRG_06455 [Saprolegnia parasitica CBS 223.65]
MGGCLSRVVLVDPHYSTTDGMQALFHSLGFTVHDTNRLHVAFLQADADSTGGLSFLEFLTCFVYKKTFTMMDVDGNGDVDFEEFVLAMWKFCLFSKEALIGFSFGLYDEDCSGEIDTFEAQRCLREVWGDKWQHNPHASTISEKLNLLADLHGGSITKGQFVKFMHSHPILLFPAFQVQHEMIVRMHGESFWRRIEDQRQAHKTKPEPWPTDDEILDRFNEYHNQTIFNGIEHAPISENAPVHDYKFKESFRTKQASKGPAKKYKSPTTIAVAARKPSIRETLRQHSIKFTARLPKGGAKKPT